MKVLSCGAGMQSMALALMSCENKLYGLRHEYVPVYDAVVFVNLGSEPKWVREQVEFIQKACKNADIPFYELEKNLYRDYMERFGNAHVSAVPFWSIGENGKKAKMWRHCTIDYKIATVEKFLKYKLLGYKYLQRIKDEDFQAHEMHIGFSYEESRRVSGKEKSKLFIKQYPLIDMKWERADSYKYILEKWGLETKASACNFCPFHTNYFFNYLKEHDPESYKEVVALDRLIEEKQKDTKIRSKIFVSRSVKRIVDLLPEDCMDAQYFDYNGKKIWNGF